MKAICKKLLSLLVVIAMVLSMVPLGGLGIFAVETNATTTETVTPGSASVTDDVQKHIDEVKANIQSLDPATVAAGTTCPMCGATDITWTPSTGALGAKADGAAYHYYLAGEIDVTNSAYNWAVVRGTGTKMCLLLDDAVLTGGGTIGAGGTDCTLNIMGTGTLTSDGTKSEDYGLVKSNGTRSTVNLYGGTYIYTGTAFGAGTVPTYGAILTSGASAVTNIYDGVVVGPETVNNTAAVYNVRIEKGIVNMYGGTVRNGVSADWGYSGNVSIASNGVLNMYGGTISGGTYVADHDGVVAATVGGNVLIGACAWNSDQNKAISTNAKFNMYGGSVIDGSCRNGGNGGGNICVLNVSECQLLGGTISGGNARTRGGNVQAQNGTTTIGGSVLIADGTAQYGGNLDVAGGTVTIEDGATISGGTATLNGGSIYVKEGKALTMNGGTVTGGKVSPTVSSSVGGGNVYVNATTEAGAGTFTMKGGTISDGEAFYFVKTNADNTTSNVGGYGGNIHGQGNVVIEGGKIEGGWAQQHGGNLSVSTGGSLTVSGGEITGGEAELQAGNIRSWQAPVTISGGYIHDGNAKGKNAVNHNVWVQGGSATSGHSLTISGGTIDGDVLAGNGPLTLSGAPVINAGKSVGLQNKGDAADVSGLTEGASIVVTAKAGDVLSVASDNAAAVAAYFTCSDSTLMVAAAADNTLVVQEAPVKEPSKDVFDPWNYDGMAYCPVCLENGTATEPVEWIAVNSATTAFTMGQGKHYYLSEDIPNAQVVADKNSGVSYIQATWGGATACLHLNGKDLTVTNGVAVFGSTGIMNIMGDGVVSGNRTSGNGSNAATILVNSSKAAGTINLYGGTYTKAATSQNAIISIQGNGGTINMYDGAVIDGTGLTNTNYPVGVNLLGGIYDATDNPHGGIATFNMYGGEIKNGTNTEGPGGNVMVGAGSVTAKTTGAAVFNMYGGTISGGTAAYGGNVFLRTGCSFNQHGGIIKGGKTTAADSYYGGGNIAIITGVYLLQDGIIADGETNLANKNAAGGNVYMRENTFIMTGGTISGGKSGTNTGGGSVYLTGKAALVVSGGTISGGEVTGTAGGGNIGVWSGTAEIKGDAQILNGKGNGYGGNIYIGTGDAANKLTISENAVISGGESTKYAGGNIAVYGKTDIAPALEITGGTITDGTAKTLGGNIYILYGEHTITGATISGGNATGTTTVNEETQAVTYVNGFGGNIYAIGDAENSVKVTMDGVTVKDGSALSYGGNAHFEYTELTIQDGTWTGGEVAVWHGGNISMSRSSAQIKGAAISGGKALNAQGGTLRAYMSQVEIDGCTITGGGAKTNSCVWFATDSGSHATPETVTYCNVTITDSSITSIDDQPAVAAGAGVTVTLDGSTTADGLLQFSTQKYTIASEVEGEEPTVIIDSAKLMVKDTWTGEAQVSLGDYYYAGNSISADHAEATGAFTGKLTNGKGTEAPILLGETLYLPAYGVVTGESAQWFGTAEEALTAYAAAEGTKYLVAGTDFALAGQEIYLDACNDIKVTGTGTVYGIDPDNDEYKRSTGTITAEGVTLVGDVTFNGNRYIKIADGSYHRIEMGIRNITLRTSAAGLYYNAYYTCDKTLAAAISSYGVVVSVNDLPGADFQNMTDDHFSVYEDFAAQYAALESGYTVAANSTSVFGIMKETNSAADNAEHGEMDIYANAYIVIGGEKIYVADEDNAGKQAGVAYSLHDVMTAMDNEEFWNSLDVKDQQNVQDFYTEWYNQGGMADWTFENIKLAQNG